MFKFAQKRGYTDRIKENLNLSGIAMEKLFNKEFAEAMKNLRTTDDLIRDIMLGNKSVDVSMKDLLSLTKTALNKREYLNSFLQLGKIHKQLMEIRQAVLNMKVDLKSIHEDLLLEQFKNNKKTWKENQQAEKKKKELIELKKQLSASYHVQLIKQAGFFDMIKNVGTKIRDGWALRSWEKRYPKEVSKWKDGTTMVLGLANEIHDFLVDSLKSMSSERANRNVENYMALANSFIGPINNFDKVLKNYYTSAVEPLVNKLEADSPVVPIAETDNESAETLKNIVIEEPTKNKDKVEIITNLQDQNEDLAETQRDPGVAKSEHVEESLLEEAMKNTLRSAHENFYHKLLKLAEYGDIHDMKLFIKKYAKLISSKDLKTSTILLKLASKIEK